MPGQNQNLPTNSIEPVTDEELAKILREGKSHSFVDYESLIKQGKCKAVQTGFSIRYS